MTAAVPGLDGPLWPFVALFLFAFLPTEIWRWLAVFFARGIDETSEIFTWVRAVASCLVMAVVARLVLFPSGALVAIPGPGRFAALASAVVGFFVFRRSIGAGLACGLIVLMASRYALAT